MIATTNYIERFERVSFKFWAQGVNGVIDLEIKTGAFSSLPHHRLIQEYVLSKGEALQSPQVAACLPVVRT